MILAAVLAVQATAASILVATLPTRHTASVTAPRIVAAQSLGGTRTDALLARVRTDLDDAVAAVEQFWGSDWPREIVVVATDSPQQFAAQAHLDPGRDWNDIAAVAVADEVDLANRRVIGQRIVLAPGASEMSDTALRIVLTHELFHLAARADTALDAPRWLTEGVADFVARPAAPLPPGAGAETALPSDAELDGPNRSMGYDRAWWFARFVADTFGVDGLHRLYTLACGPGHGDFSWAVGEAFDIDPTELQSRWAVWLNR